MYLIRLDDASEYMNIYNWKRMEKLLDKYEIKPIFGIIPNNKDPELLKYGKIKNFWKLVMNWQYKGWTPALHGYCHVFESDKGGINPVNKRSEYAGVSLERQKKKVREGFSILKSHNIQPNIFFAPAHTFDQNTLIALKEECPIRIISDTIANDVYFKDDFFFIPQQSGYCRKLPFKVTTFCYHPNIMSDQDFKDLEKFIISNKNSFSSVSEMHLKKRSFGLLDYILKKIYFMKRY